MSMEIEAKIRVEDFAEVTRRLKALRAKSLGTRDEANVFFDTPDAGLRKAGKGIRIRTHRDTKTGRVEHIVTFKGPRKPGRFKARPEYEFAVDEPKAAIAAFHGIGLETCLKFKKQRTSWMLKGCRIELDTLPSLGRFVEIEGPNAKAIQAVRELLSLEQNPLISESYAAMIAAKKRKRS